MNKRVISIIVGALAGLIIGLFLIITQAVLIFVFPEKSVAVKQGMFIVVLLLASVAVLIIFGILVINVMREMKFITLYNDELHAHGIYSEKILKEINKRKDRYKKDRFNSVYLQSVTFLANYAAVNDDFEGEAKILNDLDVNELNSKLRIESGKAKQNDLFNFVNLLSLKLALCFLEDDEKTAEFLKPFLYKVEELYFDKNEILKLTILEAKINYFATVKNIELLEDTIAKVPQFKNVNEIAEIVYIASKIKKDYVTGELTLEVLQNYINEGKEKAENHKNKVYSLQTIEVFERQLKAKAGI
ncbi:MAG: hypothetical protein K5776_03285 [Lachnospiraceae bacterium]|nr:hypothetical protein [Lachnospiraceae bacterium]